jgi:hypothetical protein
MVAPCVVVTVHFAGGESMNSGDTVQMSVPLPDTSLFADLSDTAQKRYNLFAAVGLSLAVPGAGQVYTRHPVKGALLFGAEAICGLVLFADRVPQMRRADERINLQKEKIDSLSAAQTLLNNAPGTTDSTILKLYNNAVLTERMYAFERRQTKYSMYHALGWLSGLHLWNVMDALQFSRQFDNDDTRNPTMAGLLSMVPGLALGQIYNGSLSKAGMIWMTQTMLLAMAIDHNRLMKQCIDERAFFLDTTTWESGYESLYKPLWEEKYDQAFTQRNMYLWYSVFFYLYAIFDAVVDANLHDYRRKIRLDPMFEPKTESIGLQITAPLTMRRDLNKRKSVCR